MSPTSERVIGGSVSIAFGNVGLSLPNGTSVRLTDEGLRFSDPGIQLQRGRQGYNLRPEAGNVTISLAPAAAGRLCFSGNWQAFELFALCRDKFNSSGPARGGELRYFHGPEASETLSYPLFAAIPPEDERELQLDLELDPLAPFDGAHTRMLFRAAPPLESAYGSSTSGGAVTLTPLAEGEQRAGFYFGARPGERGEAAVYLAPLGAFALGLQEGAGAEEDDLRLMCGTSGLEYLAAAAGDRLVFVPGQAAFAPNFGSKSKSESGEPLLEAKYTTSWVELAPGEGNAARAYFGQPDASPNYGAGTVPAREGKEMTLPAAVASRVRELPEGSNAFPLVLYGGALVPADLPAPAAKTLMEFEGFALAPERGARLRQSPPAEGLAAAADPAP
ncbi:MAG: hypothetical protein M3335_09055, partial [Actinomycetota bacterium]|nr:hypothetical protein [Actinomycetota bacterium]